VQIPAEDGWRDVPIGRSNKKFKAGRWTMVEQELILNQSDKENGVLRLWIDGNLAFENVNNRLRKEDDIKIGGILADIAYGGVFSHNTGAPNDTAIRVSPMTVRWQ
jgi:hypothetical protein